MQLDTSGSLYTLSVGGVMGGVMGGGVGRVEGEERGKGGGGRVKVGLKGYMIFSKTIAMHVVSSYVQTQLVWFEHIMSLGWEN